MTFGAVLASPDEIRAYLVDQLNLALRRPGMYGGELSIRMLMDHLLFVERRQEVWAEQQRVWERRGAWSETGVKGALQAVLPPDHGYSVASVYAEFAHRQGWLTADRLLDADTFESMRAAVGRWAGRDWVWSEVVAAFGPPSVLFGGTNPFYGKVFGYAAEDSGTPMVFFHLWNGTDPGTEPSWPPAHNEPLLLAVRCGDGPLSETFTYTPQGQRRRPAH